MRRRPSPASHLLQSGGRTAAPLIAVLLLGAGGLAPAGPAVADGRTAAPPKQTAQDVGTLVDRVLTEYERAVIRDYLRSQGYWHGDDRDVGRGSEGRGRGNGRGGGLPPGLQRQVDQGRGLPPGLARQLEQGRGLPPGLQTRPLPDDLASRLPSRPGTRRVMVDRTVVLIDTATNVILDVLYGP